MLLPRVLAPARAAIQTCSGAGFAPSTRVLDALRHANAASSPYKPNLTFVRHATHQAQGRANGAKDGPGKRLGAKKAGGEYVVTGNIIFRQRGTAWYPGENCAMGRDHCIYALRAGYVRYYRDPNKHPDRQYIGVVFNKDDKLPYPVNAVRKRRLDMIPVRRTPTATAEVEGEGEAKVVVEETPNATSNQVRKGAYAGRKTNWEIGRMGAENEKNVKKFVRGDRFAAWRKASVRHKAILEKKKLRSAQKAGKAKAKRKAPR